MSAGAPDDGSDIIALARAVGLSGIAPAATEEDRQRVQETRRARDPEAFGAADDIIALARAVGFPGIRPAETAEERQRVEEACRARDPKACGEVDDIVALARAVGLPGVRPAGDSPTVVRRPAARAAPPHVANDCRAAAVVPAAARPVLSIASSRPPAPQPPAERLEPMFVAFRICGAEALRAAEQWQRCNARLAATGDKGEFWLGKKNKTWPEYDAPGGVAYSDVIDVIFRAPDDSASRERLRKVSGELAPGFRMWLPPAFDRSSRSGYQFQGPGARAVPGAQLASREPPMLPPRLLSALTAANTA